MWIPNSTEKGEQGQQLPRIRGQLWESSFCCLLFYYALKCRKEEISLSKRDWTLQVKEELLESVQYNNIILKMSRLPTDPLWNSFLITVKSVGFVMSRYLERIWLCLYQPLTVLAENVEICIVIHVLRSSLFFFPGADEDVESPEPTTSRPLPKIPFTSAAPKVETTTLKAQNKMPVQTKVQFVLHYIVRLL